MRDTFAINPKKHRFELKAYNELLEKLERRRLRSQVAKLKIKLNPQLKSNVAKAERKAALSQRMSDKMKVQSAARAKKVAIRGAGMAASRASVVGGAAMLANDALKLMRSNKKFVQSKSKDRTSKFIQHKQRKFN